MKDFSGWNEKKIIIHNDNRNKLYHQRDIWWCALGINIGYEQDGKDVDFQRPVLVLKGLSMNTCLVLPITTSKQVHPLRISIGTITGKDSKVVLSQMKVVDTKRFINKIAVLGTTEFEAIRKAVRDFI